MRGALLLVGLIVSTSVSAQQAEAPTRGLLYNTTEDHSMVYECPSSDSNTIECNLTQTAVRRKLSSREAAAKLEKARSDFTKKPEPLSPEDCKMYSEMLEMLNGKRAPPESAKHKIAAASPRLKSEMMNMFAGLVAFCQSPT